MDRICPQCRQRTDAELCPDDGFHTVEAARFIAPETDPLVGKVFDKRYRVDAMLGRGGMGAVYRATQLRMSRTVALKVLSNVLADDLEQVRRFEQEAKAASLLHHPNTIKVLDFGIDETGQLFLVMEYLDGESVKELLRREGALPPDRVVHITRQILKSLAEAHTRDIFHRDLKPDNIMLRHVHGEQDFVKVVDFGIAKVAQGLDTTGTQLTATGQIVGTPRYMSPEQARGGRVDGRSDLYSLGVLMYEMLAGRPPFDSETPIALVLDHIQTPVPPLVVEGGRAIPPGLRALVQRALSKQPEERPPSAEAFLQELDAAAAGFSGAPVASASTPAMMRGVAEGSAPRRSRAPLFAALAAGVLALAVVGWLVVPRLIASGDPPAAGGEPVTDHSTTGEPQFGKPIVLPDVRVPEIEATDLAALDPPPPDLAGPLGELLGSGGGSAAGGMVAAVMPQEEAAETMPEPGPVPESASESAPTIPVEVELAKAEPRAAGSPVSRPASTRSRYTTEVRSNPPGAVVRRNGRVLGRTPLKVTVSKPSEAVVIVVAPGFLPKRVHLRPRHAIAGMTVRLQQAPAAAE